MILAHILRFWKYNHCSHRLTLGVPPDPFPPEYRSLIDLTVAASLILNEVSSALFSLPTELADRLALFLVFTSSSVLGSLALTTAWKDITEKMFNLERVCLVLLETQASKV